MIMNKRVFLMKQRQTMVLLIILSTLVLSGCWDSTELQKMDVVSAIGIDISKKNENNKYRATVQIINTSQVAGGQQVGKFQSTPVTSLSADGNSLIEALQKISSQTSGELFFPHVQILVVGEELAKQGIQDLFDVIERNSEFRVLFSVLIARNNTAENVLKIITPTDPIPSSNILGALESSSKGTGRYVNIQADKVINGLMKGSLGITGIQINGNLEEGNKDSNIQQISPNASLEISGFALFKNGKLIKWMDEEVTRGVTWIKNEVERTVVSLDCRNKHDAITIGTTLSKTNIKANTLNGRPIINIEIRTEGNVLETHCGIDLSKSEEIDKLEEQMKEEIKKEVLAVVKTTQTEKIDIFGFGDYVNIADQQLWKEISSKWENEIYSETEVNVNVEAFIRRTGMRSKPYIK